MASLSSKLRENTDESFCDNGKIVKLIFDMKQTDIANYISDVSFFKYICIYFRCYFGFYRM